MRLPGADLRLTRPRLIGRRCAMMHAKARPEGSALFLPRAQTDRTIGRRQGRRSRQWHRRLRSRRRHPSRPPIRTIRRACGNKCRESCRRSSNRTYTIRSTGRRNGTSLHPRSTRVCGPAGRIGRQSLDLKSRFRHYKTLCLHLRADCGLPTRRCCNGWHRNISPRRCQPTSVAPGGTAADGRTIEAGGVEN